MLDSRFNVTPNSHDVGGVCGRINRCCGQINRLEIRGEVCRKHGQMWSRPSRDVPDSVAMRKPCKYNDDTRYMTKLLQWTTRRLSGNTVIMKNRILCLVQRRQVVERWTQNHM